MQLELTLDPLTNKNYIAVGKIMSKRCELTGISPLKGHNVSHAKNKTKRRFLPNLKKVVFKSDILKKNIKLNVTSAALRTVDFKGGLDKFLKTAKNKNLKEKILFLKDNPLIRDSMSKEGKKIASPLTSRNMCLKYLQLAVNLFGLRMKRTKMLVME